MRHSASLILLAFLTLLPGALPAQSAAPRTGPYLTLDYGAGAIRSETGYLAGAEVGAIFKQRFSVGLAGYSLANREALVPAEPGTPGTEPLGLGYGGLRVGYLFGADATIHPVADLMMGAGEIRGRTSDREDRVVVFESSVMMEANLARYLRGALGVTYRFVTGSDLAGVSDRSLSGAAARLTLRFGLF